MALPIRGMGVPDCIALLHDCVLVSLLLSGGKRALGSEGLQKPEPVKKGGSDSSISVKPA